MTLPRKAQSTTLQQIPFDLGSRHASGREDVLSGPAASGKSHLAAVWRERANAAMIRPDTLTTRNAEDIAQSGAHIVIDGLDPWLGDAKAETTLFHLYNILGSEKRSLMVTMRMTPTQIDFAVPDLASRFRASLMAAIRAPDDDLLSSILVKLFHDRQLAVTEEVIRYVLPRMERSFAAARDIVEKIDRMSLAEKRGVSIPLMRQALAETQ